MRQGQASGGLHIIFAIFLGLMVTAFVGVGVYTFYPSPWDEVQPRLIELSREEQRLTSMRTPETLTDEERRSLEAVRDERHRLEDERRIAQERWTRVTSIILVGLATLVMALSLTRPARLPVISNGLLLGGVFTMLYGVGWIVVSDASTMRFGVLSLALLITLGMGYVRFVRGVPEAAPRSATGLPGAPGVAALDERVRRLEARLDEAAKALRTDRS